MKPLGFHLTNVLWHALVSALVCAYTAKLTGSRPAALTAGILFAIHPAHVESVTFVSGRTDVIATAFVLLSLLNFPPESEEPATGRRILSIAFFACALLAKEVAVVLPALLAVTELASGRRRGTRALIVLHAPYWVVLVAYLAARFLLLRIVPSIDGVLSTRELLFTMPIVVVDYLRILIFPVRLCADYIVTLRTAANMATLGGIFTVLLACGATGFLIWRRSVAGLFAAWIVLGLLPVLQIVPISVLKAERFLYLSSVGFCGLAAILFSMIYEGSGGSRRKLAAATLIVITLLLSLRTMARNTVWKDELTLYKTTALCAPGNFRVQYNLGNAYSREGDLERALHHTELAMRLRPDFPQVNYNLGVMYAAAGRTDDSEQMYRRAISLDPDYALAHNNLGALLYSRGLTAEARVHWQKALSIDPGLGPAKEGLRLLDQAPQ
jgi:hypothetical protein